VTTTPAVASVPPATPVAAPARTPVVAVAVQPVRAHRHERPAPKSHGKHHGNPHVPPTLAEPAQPTEQTEPAAPKHTGKPATHGHGNANGKGKGKGHGHAGSAPSTDDTTAPPASQGHGRPDNPGNSHKPDKSQGQSPPVLTVPELPVTVPDGLTQTSQNQDARNDPLRHLHP